MDAFVQCHDAAYHVECYIELAVWVVQFVDLVGCRACQNCFDPGILLRRAEMAEALGVVAIRIVIR